MEYTLDELVAAVGASIAIAGLDRQANGQVSAFPDRRTLRYYTTIGLMDRPDAVRDRQAIYSDQHVTEAVAVKRLQADGLPLAAIQARLAGLPISSISAIASGTPPAPPAAVPPAAVPPPAAGRGRFWTHHVPVSGRATQRLLSVPLAPGATLLVTTDLSLSPDEVAGIHAAAAALVDHLAATGLTAFDAHERDVQ
jgi:DNA-binding transcriptional MerR regulator